MQNDSEDYTRETQSRFDKEIRDKFERTETVAITSQDSWPPSSRDVMVTVRELKILLELQKKYHTIGTAIEKLGKNDPVIKLAIAVSKRTSPKSITLYY